MPAPIKWRSKILLFKLEATYGADATPTGAANGILATEVKLTPMEGQDVSRDLETPWLGAQPTIPADLHAKLSFRVELEPSGTAGTAPAWGGLIRACAMAETIVAATSVTYNPVTDAHESGTFYLWLGATLQKIKGARGNCMLKVDASGIPYLEFEFTGLWAAPEEAARDTPTLTGFEKPQVASNANTPGFTVGATPLVLRSFQLDFGNQVEPRFLIGAENVVITDKAEAIQMTVEAVPLTTLDPFALAASQAATALELVHGTTAGRIVTLAVPAMQMQRPQAPQQAQGIVEWPLRAVPLPQAGNDQFTLTLT
ncbi:hypothetical protein T8T21_00695 [Limimaricola variabilis]|uniref:phage tail tube protein n=1 Tax=Limimaricola variabilis TaxID=1492771 RepID=UPI002AC95356|nr:phage tail tube protein [Limimaricola variabilis]WPY94676.1 hypothetical protein T8T21_00695 [Limimaricola variabilis]